VQCYRISKFINTPECLLREAHTETVHISTDRRRLSSALNVRFFRGADCDVEHPLEANVAEKLAVSKRAIERIDTERFNVKKLNERDAKEGYQVAISNKFADLENLVHLGHLRGMGQYYRDHQNFDPRESRLL
jgi:hypothetical protein